MIDMYSTVSCLYRACINGKTKIFCNQCNAVCSVIMASVPLELHCQATKDLKIPKLPMNELYIVLVVLGSEYKE